MGNTVAVLLRGAGKFVVPLRSWLVKELEEATAHVLLASDWQPLPGGEAWVTDTLSAAGVPWDEL